MIPIIDFQEIILQLRSAGWADGDIEWSENIIPPISADDFAEEAIYVICNSGMRFTVARSIFDRVMKCLRSDESSAAAFGHKGKCSAIDTIWRDREKLLVQYLASDDRLAFLGSLPWIGGITRYHLAKNFGLDVVKPDVHLQRLADAHSVTPHELCADLARQTGYRIATIDTVLWRACATGVIDSRTGKFPAYDKSEVA